MPRPRKEKPNRSDQRYEVKITVGKTLDGKLRRKSFYSTVSKADAHAQAQAYLVAQEAARLTGHSFVSRETNFAKWARTWLETYKKPNVKANTYEGTYRGPVEGHLIPYFGKADLDDIRPADVQAYFTEKGRTMSQESLHKQYTALTAIFDTAIENDLCIKNPVVKSIRLVSAKKRPEKQSYTAEQYAAVLSFVTDREDGLSLRVLLETGLSRSELLGLRWEDLDAAACTLTIRQGLVEVKDPDTGKRKIVTEGLKTAYRARVVPISQDLAAALDAKPRTVGKANRKYKKGYDEPLQTEFIFHSPSGLPERPNNWMHRVYTPVMEAMHAAHPEIPILSPHELRHTRATLWKDAGVDLFTIAKTLGHGDLDMLAKRYAHDNIELRRAALGLAVGKGMPDDTPSKSDDTLTTKGPV